MLENDFLTLLVDETLKLQKAGEVKLSSFELKLKDYDLSFLKGEFIPQFKVLRFLTPFGILDIPINWSTFDFNLNCSETLITEESDPDYLLKVLKYSWSKELKRLFITHADGFCYIVGLKAGEEGHLHDLKTPVEILRAA